MRTKLLPLILLLFCFSCKQNTSDRKQAEKERTSTSVIDTMAILTWITDSIERYKLEHSSDDYIDTQPYNNILRWKIDKEEKVVRVWLSKKSKEAIQKFQKDVLDSPFIQLCKSSPLEETRRWEDNDFWYEGISYRMTTPIKTLTYPLPEKMEVTIRNDSPEEIMTGMRYTVEYNDNGSWKRINFILNDDSMLAFHDLGIIIPAHSSETYDIPIYPDLYEYPPGDYRITKSISIDKELKHKDKHSKHWEKYHLIVTFRIEKKLPPVPVTWITDSIQRYMDRYPSANPWVGVGQPDAKIKAANYILSWEENQKDNTVTVWLSHTNEKMINAFRKEVMDTPQIHFRKTSPLVPFEELWGRTKDDFWWEGPGYYLTMPKQTFTIPLPEQLSVTIHNETEYDSMTGYYHWVEYNDNGIWKLIDFRTDDNLSFSIPDVGFSLLSNSKQLFTISLHPDLYDYQPGEYRIRKQFSIEGRFRMEGNSRFPEAYYIAIPFWIE